MYNTWKVKIYHAFAHIPVWNCGHYIELWRNDLLIEKHFDKDHCINFPESTEHIDYMDTFKYNFAEYLVEKHYFNSKRTPSVIDWNNCVIYSEDECVRLLAAKYEKESTT